ncbi:MAG: hypothetical protein AB8B69_17335 [Chitinophagales bacterium]
MMTENEKIKLVEGYVFKTLSDKDLESLTQLRKNEPGVEDQIAFYEDLYGGAVLFGDERFKMELQEMEVNWQLKQSKLKQSSLKDKWQSLTDKVNETIDDLAQFFLPVPNYEAALLQASRSTAAGLTAPENGLDAENELSFSFEKPLTKNQSFTIEDNQQILVEERVLEEGTKQFVVDTQNFVPGRYYWKLTGNRETLIGMFFVGRS